MLKRNMVRETVLYYNPGSKSHVAKLKGVLVQMGIRIKNVTAEQVQESIGSLLGLAGYDEKGAANDRNSSQRDLPEIADEILVMHQFTGRRIDELLLNLRKAGVPKINLKAIVTESNVSWTFYHLYEEIKEEHEKMQGENQDN